MAFDAEKMRTERINRRLATYAVKSVKGRTVCIHGNSSDEVISVSQVREQSQVAIAIDRSAIPEFIEALNAVFAATQPPEE